MSRHIARYQNSKSGQESHGEICMRMRLLKIKLPPSLDSILNSLSPYGTISNDPKHLVLKNKIKSFGHSVSPTAIKDSFFFCFDLTEPLDRRRNDISVINTKGLELGLCSPASIELYTTIQVIHSMEIAQLNEVILTD